MLQDELSRARQALEAASALEDVNGDETNDRVPGVFRKPSSCILHMPGSITALDNVALGD